MSESVSDYDAIVDVVQLYVEGMRKGDSGPLKDAFHADARMFGSLAGVRYDVPISDLFAMADGGSADVDGSYQAESCRSSKLATRQQQPSSKKARGARCPSSTSSRSCGATERGRSRRRSSRTPAANRLATRCRENADRRDRENLLGHGGGDSG